MKLRDFAEKHRLKVRKDGCGDEIIAGRFMAKDIRKRWEYHHHIYDAHNGRFGLCLMFSSRRAMTGSRKKALSAGFLPRQEAHSECTLLFDPADEKQSRAAIKLAGIKRRRVATPSQVESLTRFGKPFARRALQPLGTTIDA